MTKKENTNKAFQIEALNERRIDKQIQKQKLELEIQMLDRKLIKLGHIFSVETTPTPLSK